MPVPPFSTEETSVQDGQPILLFTFVLPTATHTLTNAEQDVVFGGITYTAISISHSNRTVMPTGKVRELSITMPAKHALPQTLLSGGIPPRDCLVTITKIHRSALDGSLSLGTVAWQVWKGYIVGVGTDGQYVQFRVPSKLDDQFNVQLPMATAQRTCGHILYDRGCNVSRTDPTKFVETTIAIISADGLTLTLTSDGGKSDNAFAFGEIVRPVDGERRSVLTHIGNAITIDVPFKTLVVGDSVTVFIGCDHSLNHCLNIHNNIPNFGGHPDMPTTNPSAPTKFGVIVNV